MLESDQWDTLLGRDESAELQGLDSGRAGFVVGYRRWERYMNDTG